MVVRPLKKPHRSWQAFTPCLRDAVCFLLLSIWKCLEDEDAQATSYLARAYRISSAMVSFIEASSWNMLHHCTHFYRQTRDLFDECRPQLCNGVRKPRSIAVCGVMLFAPFYNGVATIKPEKRDCRCCAWQNLVNTKARGPMGGS